jgi:HrpA-like RNA helicase
MIKGKLVAPNGDTALQAELDDWVPVDYVIDWFRTRLNRTGIDNRVLILKSETASGKSTMFPPELYKALVRGTGDMSPGIICTQPRVMTAIENVNEMLKFYSKVLRLGETLGWSTKPNKIRPAVSASLLSATIGTLTQILKTQTDEEIMKKYRYILIDETHERDLQTDMTIYMLKNLLLRNQGNTNCPFVVLMSATFEPQSFLDYFKLDLIKNFIWCRGETAPIDERWDWNEGRTVNDYPRAAASVVERIIDENPDDDPSAGDILIFMPGAAEIKDTADWLDKINVKLARAGKKIFSPLKIDGDVVRKRSRDFMWALYVPVSEQEVIIDNHKHIPGRRVIISTNVAETGLTLENLKYVIDGGFNREIEYNPIFGIHALLTKPAPKSRIRQRRGRVGRKFSGVFYPLYPKYIYDRLPDLQYPQILIDDVSGIIISIISEQLKVKTLTGDSNPQFNVNDIDMIDVPTPDALAACIEKLYTIGFISTTAPSWDPDQKVLLANELGERFSLTKLGSIAEAFSLMVPESARMILAAYSWGASVLDLVTIAAYMTIDSRFFVAAQPVDPSGKPPPKIGINWTQVYKMGLPGFWSSSSILYKTRLLIADDFINGLILFNAVKRIIGEGDSKTAVTDLRVWCQQNNIAYEQILTFIQTRDDIIDQMLTAELDLFTNEEFSLNNSSADDIMNTITKIKHCIYDGYRGNVLIRDGEIYKTLNGLEVLKPKIFQDDEKTQIEKSEYGFALEAIPSLLVYNSLALKANRKTSMYEAITDRVSSLDGFVSIDPDFTN